LKEISGVGPKLEEKLNSIGIYKFEQIANWTEENIREFDELLSFKGRIERDEWLTKAKELHEAKGK
jgi:predicted flap endonuclease-1-like 5' DNA nuclease